MFLESLVQVPSSSDDCKNLFIHCLSESNCEKKKQQEFLLQFIDKAAHKNRHPFQTFVLLIGKSINVLETLKSQKFEAAFSMLLKMSYVLLWQMKRSTEVFDIFNFTLMEEPREFFCFQQDQAGATLGSP